MGVEPITASWPEPRPVLQTGGNPVPSPPHSKNFNLLARRGQLEPIPIENLFYLNRISPAPGEARYIFPGNLAVHQYGDVPTWVLVKCLLGLNYGDGARETPRVNFKSSRSHFNLLSQRSEHPQIMRAEGVLSLSLPVKEGFLHSSEYFYDSLVGRAAHGGLFLIMSCRA